MNSVCTEFSRTTGESGGVSDPRASRSHQRAIVLEGLRGEESIATLCHFGTQAQADSFLDLSVP